MTEQGCFGLKKGADPPAVIRSAPLGVWGVVGVGSRCSRKSTCAVGRVRAGLVMGAGGERDGERGLEVKGMA